MDYLINLLKNSETLSATHLTPVFLIIIGVFIALTSLLGFISATNGKIILKYKKITNINYTTTKDTQFFI